MPIVWTRRPADAPAACRARSGQGGGVARERRWSWPNRTGGGGRTHRPQRGTSPSPIRGQGSSARRFSDMHAALLPRQHVAEPSDHQCTVSPPTGRGAA
jgi:hypothetical protein